MPSLIAFMTVKAGSEDEFLRLVDELTATVRRDEPGCTRYEYYRVRDVERRYAAVEAFASPEAAAEHRETAWFQRLVPPIMECLDGPLEVHELDPVAEAG